MVQGEDAFQPALTARQADIYRRLTGLVGVGTAEFWREACDRVAETPVRPTTTHMVGHALREVDSAIRAVLEERAMTQVSRDEVKRAKEAKTSGNLKISAICDDLQIPAAHPLRAFWLGQNPEVEISLHRRAHRNGLDYPRPVDADFRTFFLQMEALFDLLLERFERRYRAVFDDLDLLLAEKHPTEEHAERLAQKFPANETARRYFFTRASVAWLGPLRNKEFFLYPPQPVLDPDGQVPILNRWPESEYLVRTAVQNPAATLDAALDVPPTDNSYVIWDLVKVALALTPADGVRLVPTIVASVPGPYGVIAMDEFGDLALRLAQAGHVDSGCDLLQSLLADIPASDHDSSRVYDYVSVIRKVVPDVTALAGLPMVDYTIGLLDRAVSTYGDNGEDHSQIWRPSVQAHADDAHGPDVRDALVDAVRSAAENLLSSGQTSLQQITSLLEAHSALIFRRLALHLLREHGQHDRETLRRYLFDHRLLAHRGAGHEFQLLLRDAHRWLPPDELTPLVEQILAGPDTNVWKKRLAEGDRHPNSDALVRVLADGWVRDRLAPLEPILDAAAKQRYKQLIDLHGPAPDLSVTPKRFFSAWNEEPAAHAADLASLTAVELADFLTNWQPAQDWREQGRSTIRPALSASTTAAAEQRSQDASTLIGVEAVYADAILEGFNVAAQERRVLDWPALADFLTWINDQAVQELAAGSTTRADRQWRPARYNMLRLIGIGLHDFDHAIPASCEPAITAIVRSAAVDPDPSTDVEGATGSQTLDAVRPIALEAAVRLAWWKRRTDSSCALTELLGLIEQHLDPVDQAPAVRETIGRQLPVLYALDPAWTRDHIAHILPMAPGREAMWEAAWQGYLDNQSPPDQVWELLLPHYIHAVDRLNPTGDDWALTRASQLASHLGRRYWFGNLSLDDHNGLLRRFYQQAPTQAATVIVEMTGNSLPAAIPLEPEHQERLIKLWEYRLTEAPTAPEYRELWLFDDWYLSGAFDEAWALTQLYKVMIKEAKFHPSIRTLRRMRTTVGQHASACLDIFEQWLDNGPAYWEYARGIEEIKAILRAAASAGAAEYARVEQIVSRFAFLGTDLRSVMSPVQGNADDDRKGANGDILSSDSPIRHATSTSPAHRAPATED